MIEYFITHIKNYNGFFVNKFNFFAGGKKYRERGFENEQF